MDGKRKWETARGEEGAVEGSARPFPFESGFPSLERGSGRQGAGQGRPGEGKGASRSFSLSGGGRAGCEEVVLACMGQCKC